VQVLGSSAKVAAGASAVLFENRYRCRDGGYRWLHWSARSDGTTWFAIAFDVSERKETEERLRQSDAQVTAIIDHCPVGVYLVDSDLRIQQVNHLAQAVFGLQFDGLVLELCAGGAPVDEHHRAAQHRTTDDQRRAAEQLGGGQRCGEHESARASVRCDVKSLVCHVGSCSPSS
jgi:PAS domain-containing protein